MARFGVLLATLCLVAFSSGISCTKDEVNRLAYFLIQNDYTTFAQILSRTNLFSTLAKQISSGTQLTILAPTEDALQRFKTPECQKALESAVLHQMVLGLHKAETLLGAEAGSQYPVASGKVILKEQQAPMKLRLQGSAGEGIETQVVAPDAYGSKKVIVHGVDSLLDTSCLEGKQEAQPTEAIKLAIKAALPRWWE